MSDVADPGMSDVADPGMSDEPGGTGATDEVPHGVRR